MTAVYVVPGVLALLAAWIAAAYIGLIKASGRVDEAWSALGVQLRRRHDLVPNLVESVKGHAAHERETLQNVAMARLAAVEAAEPAAVERAETWLTSSLGGFDALVEAYPQLRASESFQRLWGALGPIESEIQTARRVYNSNVRRYNVRTRQFPAVLIAGTLAFAPRDLFEVDAPPERNVPQVAFQARA